MRTNRKSLQTAEVLRQYKYGEGVGASGNSQEEILVGNINAPYFGGSKYGLIQSDLSGFENSPALSFNNGSQAFDFRRTLARSGNMPDKILEFPCIDYIRTHFNQPPWQTLWNNSWEYMYEQIVNEAIWIALAWGFHPGIEELLPVHTSGDLDQFVESRIRRKFTGIGGHLGYTAIYKELHLAGWHPINNAVALNDGEPLSLFIERFGPSLGTGEANAKYFTALNNDTLSYTLIQMTEEQIDQAPPPEIYFDDIPDLQTLNDTQKCSIVQDPSLYPGWDAAVDHFDEKNKRFHLYIKDPVQFALHHGNLHAKQLVYNLDEPDVCNWPNIVSAEFDDGTIGGPYSIKRTLTSVIIGGTKLGSTQGKITLEDKALLVFKIWPSLLVNNGESGEGRDGAGEGTWAETSMLWSFYERYGDGWQRQESDAGYNGNLDLVLANSPGACVNYKFTLGESDRYHVWVHVPRSSRTPSPALYEAYILDYLEGPVGPTPSGEPIWSHVLDLEETETYDQNWDEDGFFEIGAIDVSLGEPALATLVIRLSDGTSEADRTSAGSVYLLADAVKLVQEGEE